MIPRILELKNFLSYGDTPVVIDFKDYNLICLSGKNGNGKSALLDALTWAIWGQARKTGGNAKPDEGLLRLGQTRMVVSLEFDCGDGRYRVRREYTKSYGKPLAALDFEVYDTVSDRFVSLTDKTIKATQAKIEHVVGLDFETFTNSAFLRQGQSNEFSKKSAKERKAIFSTILGLGRYDKLQDAANAHTRGLTEQRKTASALLLRAEETCKLKPDLVSLAEQLSKELINLGIEKAATTSLCEKLHSEKAQAISSLEKKKEALTSAEKALADFEALSTQLREILAAWKATHSLTIKKADPAHLHKEKEVILEKQAELIKQQQARMILQEQISNFVAKKNELLLKHEQSFNKRTQELLHEITRGKLSLDSMLKQKEQAEKNSLLLDQEHQVLNKKIESLTQAQKNYALLEHEINLIKKQFEKRRSFYQNLVQKGNWAKNELTELERKQKIVHDAENPACPLCEQLLTAKRKQYIALNLISHEAFLRHRIATVSKLLVRLKDILVVQHKQLDTQEKALVEMTKQQALATEIEAQIIKNQEQNKTLKIEIERYQKLITDQKSSIAELEKEHLKIVTEKEQGPQSAEFKALEKELSDKKTEYEKKPYDQKVQEALARELEAVNQKISQLAALESESLLQAKRKADIEMLCRHARSLKTIIQSIPTLKQEAAQLELLTKEIDLKLTEQTKKAHTVSTLIEEAKQREGSALQSLETITQAEEEIKKHIADISLIDAEIEQYSTLAQAFGKNGIQALLIEDAIPEVEQEANKLLARLTNNQSQIFIESVRDLKSGGIKETLDIHIADSAGVRPYEMYSGGEAFRVDFSLRVAIAKLLARRAGRALQTLIIDEGFGSQDEDGLGHIMDALYAIQSDFSRIIVVSHLPEFKHNFPVHFTVDKGITGSQVSIEERG